MVVELRDKLAAAESETLSSGGSVAATGRGGISGDVVSALLNLGYDSRAAEAAVERAGRDDGAGGNFEALLRAALHALSTPGRR
jgi:Holliday junction resolvasome RuvABC DNA-binding subunit